jgi:hypothetical protein
MENEKNINEDSNSILSNIKKGGDFKTPPKYFDGFQKRVQNQIKQQDLPWFNFPQYKIAFTGIAAILIGVVVMLNINKPKNLVVSDLSNEEINSYFEEYIDEYNVAEILEEISLTDLTEIETEVKDTVKVNPKSEIELINELTDEEIVEYLIDEGYEDSDWDEL